MRREIKILKRQLDEIIKNYEEVPYGCGCNLGAEERRRAQIEKLKRAIEKVEESSIMVSENGRKAG